MYGILYNNKNSKKASKSSVSPKFLYVCNRFEYFSIVYVLLWENRQNEINI